jgi:hypothetical protein
VRLPGTRVTDKDNISLFGSETPPAGAGGIFWLQAKKELEPFGLPLHLQTGVWSFMRLNNTNQEVKKLETQVGKLEQMIGKLTMENYILKKEKEYLLQRKKEDSSIITGPYLNPSKKAVD